MRFDSIITACCAGTSLVSAQRSSLSGGGSLSDLPESSLLSLDSCEATALPIWLEAGDKEVRYTTECVPVAHRQSIIHGGKEYIISRTIPYLDCMLDEERKKNAEALALCHKASFLAGHRKYLPCRWASAQLCHISQRHAIYASPQQGFP